MKLSISATTARTNFAPILLQGPLEVVFEKASGWGYDAVELHLRAPHEIDWDQVVNLSTNYSLPVTAIGTGAGARVDGLTFTNPDFEIREKAIERIKEHIKFAKLLDASIIIGSFNGNIQSNSEKGYHLDCLKECCLIASNENVPLLLEPLNRYESNWLNSMFHTMAIIEKIGYDKLKYLADTFHMNIEEADINKSLIDAGSRLGYVHLVDSNRQVPGNGHIQFESILKTLVNINYNGVLSFECLPLPDIETASVNGLKHIKELLLSIA